MKCKKCNNNVPDDMNFCPKCGCKMNNKSMQKYKKYFVLLVFVGVIISTLLSLNVFSSSIESKAEKYNKEIIEAFNNDNADKAIQLENELNEWKCSLPYEKQNVVNAVNSRYYQEKFNANRRRNMRRMGY